MNYLTVFYFVLTMAAGWGYNPDESEFARPYDSTRGITAEWILFAIIITLGFMIFFYFRVRHAINKDKKNNSFKKRKR